jgi:hypothetical protein
MLQTKRNGFGILIGIVVLLCTAYAAAPGNFLPDFVFKGSTLAGWHSLGQAEWKAVNGEIVADTGSAGGWLVLDKSYQDVQFYTELRCASPCNAGILMRGAKTPDGGLKGLYVSLGSSDFASYILTLDAQGREVSRDKLKAAAGRGGFPSLPSARGSAEPARGSARGQAAAPSQDSARGQAAAPTQGSARGQAAAPTQGSGRGPAPIPKQVAGDWNKIEIALSGSSYFKPTIGGISITAGGLDDVPGYGTIALYAGGPGEVRFRDVSWKDLLSVTEPKEQTSSHFTVQHLVDYYYGWSAVSADVNHDGILDVVYGPFYFLGPNFTERRWYREGRVYNPATEFVPDMINFAYDFTGDGWPDILSQGLDFSQPTRWFDLYVNPKGESRRWDKFDRVIPDFGAETSIMRDVDGDGKPEVLYSTPTGLVYRKPDPEHPTQTWVLHRISSDKAYQHGIGVGDINGDKRMDVVCSEGWFEQGATPDNWTFHAADLAPQGAEMGVYDVNGDGLNDIVGSSNPHGFGLAWFEQKRDSSGTISFVQHIIAGDYSTKNPGNVTFSEPHATAFGDFDGNGIKDMVVGKSFWHHLDTWTGAPDIYGPAVLYLYRAVRNPQAPGGAEFVPELIHNRSGVGAALEVVDLNKDGALDILTASGKGAFVALGKPGSWKKQANAADAKPVKK